MSPPPTTAVEITLPQRHARGEAGLRLFFGLIALAAAMWLLAVDPRPIPRILALLAILFGLLWTRRFLQQKPQEDVLCLGKAGLSLRRAGDRQEVPWEAIERIEVDHDALVVCVIRNDSSELRIDPGYGGLGLVDLAELVWARRQARQACTDESDD